MTVETIEQQFREKVSAKVTLATEGENHFRVFTPFQFDDKDHLSIVLKRSNGSWYLSDEGHTYMHLTYDVPEKDLQRGTRAKVITNALDAFSVQDKEGELVLYVTENRFGDALYDYVQALLRVTDVSYLSRERVRSTFLEDFRSFMIEQVPEDRRAFDWNDPAHDPAGNYQVDCRINGTSSPVFVLALPTDDRVRDATISLLQFERWELSFRSLGVFEDQEQVNRKVLARFSDTCEQAVFKSFGQSGSHFTLPSSGHWLDCRLTCPCTSQAITFSEEAFRLSTWTIRWNVSAPSCKFAESPAGDGRQC